MSNSLNEKSSSTLDIQRKIAHKIKEIEPQLTETNDSTKKENLLIQKNNAYYKLEKIHKELENVEAILNEDDTDPKKLETEEAIKSRTKKYGFRNRK